MSCGSHHYVVLDKEGSVFTWGFGGDGRLGLGDDGITPGPIKVEGLPKVPLDIASPRMAVVQSSRFVDL